MFLVMENSFDVFVEETAKLFGEEVGMWIYTDWPQRFRSFIGVFGGLMCR